jgi:hypothetical protein
MKTQINAADSVAKPTQRLIQFDNLPHQKNPIFSIGNISLSAD